MTNKILLSGGLVYDSILLHKGEFHARILPESLSRLNVAFGVQDEKQEFGGCAGNIAYNLSLLNLQPMLIASIGHDGDKFIKWLEQNNISTQYLHQSSQQTAHAWILTDTQNNQITGFMAGCMKEKCKIPTITPKLWHLAPDMCEVTSEYIKEAIYQEKDYFFDPGQALPAFLEGDGEHIISLEKILNNANGIFLNEYEFELIYEKLGESFFNVFNNKTMFIIKTLGSKGVWCYKKDTSFSVDVANADKIIDPTGCGDAFRAGFLYGYLNQFDLKQCVELGAVMGSFAIEQHGGQNHKVTIQKLINRYQKNYLDYIVSPV